MGLAVQETCAGKETQARLWTIIMAAKAGFLRELLELGGKEASV